MKVNYNDFIIDTFKESEVEKIFGPAGTGKTTYLINELKSLFKKGITADRIAFVSFTNRAVNELVERCTKEFSHIDKDGFKYFRTIHSLCFKSLGNGCKVIQQTDLIKLAKSQGLDMSSYRAIEDGGGNKKGDQVVTIDNLSRLRMVPLEDQWKESNFPDLPYRTVLNWQNVYFAYKEKNKLVDFTDMLFLYNSPLDVDYIFIDECQDLSPLQWAVMDVAAKNCKKIYIAGDDDQSIYQWAGAEIDYILNIRAKKDIVLPKSYRLPKKIYDISSTILDRIKVRHPKKYTHNGEIGQVDFIKDFTNVDYKSEEDCLVLVRNRWQLKEIKLYLEEQGLPYSLFNQSSLATPEVEALIYWENMRKGKELPPKHFKTMIKFSKSLRRLMSVSQIPRELYDQPWFEVFDLIPNEKKNYIRKVLKGGHKLFEAPKIKLSTIHQSKGGEAQTVILLTDVSNLVWENIWKDDEHRVWYVAVTRAKNKLILVSEQSNKFYKI